MRYSVKVRFSADGSFSVTGKEIKISLKSAPQKGRANAELLKKLADHFKVGQAQVRIVSGLTSTKKLVEIS
ncbi:MAG: DUF167 domain-containing protein [Nitrososphaera sp.]